MGLATSHGQELDDSSVADTDAATDAVARSLEASGPDPVDVVCILEGQLVPLAEIGALSEGESPS